jgi:hypothetical protein
MKSKYAQKLNNLNILLGIHIAFKLVIILTLFIVLYTTIWVKEIYLTIIKTSAYIQIFIFLALALVMLAANNPKSFDVCSPLLHYIYLIISILELGIIICEIYYMIQNLQIFLTVFHECPYYRTYAEISDSDYKRTCLYYTLDYNNELPYKYICYYNSENEYYNNFCDGLICKKNTKDSINSFIQCFGNVEKESIHFDDNNEFYLKELELINRYKSSSLFACFRKEKIIKNENLFNKKCPDSNPVEKMLIFIYSDIILHFLIDFLFIYEFILLQKIKEIYSNLVLLQSVAHLNIVPNEDDINSEINRNKQTFNTDNRDPQSQYTFNIQRENSQTIIIEPGQNNNNIQDNDNKLNMSTQNQLTHFENMAVDYNEYNYKNDDNKNKEPIENNGLINLKAKIFKLKREKTNNTNIDEKLMKNLNHMKENNTKNSNKRMVIVDVKKDEEYGINKINFFIKKKRKKKSLKYKITKTRNNINDDLKTINTNIIGNNINDINIIDNKTATQINTKNKNSERESKKDFFQKESTNVLKEIKDNKRYKRIVSFSLNENNSIKIIRNKISGNNMDINIKNKSNILKRNNDLDGIEINQESSDKTINSKSNKNISEDKIMLDTIESDVIKKLKKNKYKDEEDINKKIIKKKSHEIEKKKGSEKEISNEKIFNSNDCINDSNDNNRDNQIDDSKKKSLNDIHINSDIFLTDEKLENKNDNKIINNNIENHPHEMYIIKLSSVNSTLTASNKK